MSREIVIEKIIGMIERYDMFAGGDGIVIGFSGGPDSACLVHALNGLRQRYNIKLYAAHLNHMIRGEEADRDEAFAKSFAEALEIPFYLKRIGVEAYAREHGLSSEEAGRFLRYEFFEQVLKDTGAGKIALAHNMNDQAETMIMRFVRGTGIGGIAGIRPVRDEKFIRPILSCTREEIEEYCQLNNIGAVIDSTNKESIYTRNRIRLEVIPYIKEHFNPNVVENLFKVSEILRDEDEYLDECAAAAIEKIRNDKGINRINFKNYPLAIKRRIIRLLIKEAKGDLTGIDSKHVEDCIVFAENKGTGKTINLPDNLRCVMEYEYFRISEKTEQKDYEFQIIIPGKTKALDGYIINTRIHDYQYSCNNNEFLDKKFVKYFDYDKIKDMLFFRNRRNGDFILPKGMQGSKKLKDIFIDKKIPKDRRQQIPLIALDSEVLWIINLRDSKNYKIDSATKKVLEISIERGGVNGQSY